MKRLSILLLILLAFVVGITLIYVRGDSNSRPADPDDLSTSLEVNRMHSASAEAINSHDTDSMKQAIEQNRTAKQIENEREQISRNDCLTIQDYLSLDGYDEVEKWKSSWGNPFQASFGTGISSQFESLLLQQPSTLVSLAEQDDPMAMQALGMQYIHKAFYLGDMERLANQYNSAYQLQTRDTIDTDALVAGRYWLEQAAIQGSVYAYIEIALSYLNELDFLSRTDQLSPEEYDRLFSEMEAYSRLFKSEMIFSPESFIEIGELSSNIEALAEEKVRERLDQIQLAREAKQITLPDFIPPPEWNKLKQITICQENLLQ